MEQVGSSERNRRSARGLSRDLVVDSALRFIDLYGAQGLSMRKLAQDLGVEAMSLYHHVANKDAILDALVDAVFAEIYTPCIGEPWAAELRLRCRSGREVLTRHPWAIGLMDSRKGAGFETLRHHDAVLGCLREAGFTLEAAGAAFAVLDAYLYGFLVQELALPFSDDAGPADVTPSLGGGRFVTGVTAYHRAQAQARATERRPRRPAAR